MGSEMPLRDGSPARHVGGVPDSSHAIATSKLRRQLGSGVVLTDAKSCQTASYDSGRMSFLPVAVVKPRRRQDIAVALALANQFKVPVTPRGRGTTLMGSATPRLGGWVLDLLRLNRVRVDAEAGFAHVQAGAIVDKIQSAAAAQGWFYPPDPSSKAYCTIGGNIACNAGGMHGGKYGVTRDYVIALKGYLPTGEYVEWGTATRKFAAGFNLRDLWIGAEGMLGVVTDAVLRLIPSPEERWTLLASFADELAVFRAARALFSQRLQPAICEFLDRYSVQCAESAMGASVLAGPPGRPVMLLEFAGSAPEVRATKRAALAWARTQAVGHRVARTRQAAEALWAVRRQCSGAMFQMGDAKLNEDVTVPLSRYETFARFLERLRRTSGLAIPTFGHLGDGNLHVNIMYHQDNPDECRRAEAAVRQLMERVVSLGGAISGEHGIGLAKTPFLRLQHSAAEIGAMRRIKAALDPRGILNPGKMFEVFEVWKHPRVDVKFPWDHV